MNQPRWLESEPLIKRILHRFLDRLDKHPDETVAKLQAIVLREEDFPALFQPRGTDNPDDTWACLRELERASILALQPSKGLRLHDPEYKGAKVRLNPTGIAIVRDWLQRPHPSRSRTDWTALVRQFADRFTGTIEPLLEPRWASVGLDSELFLRGLVVVGELLDRHLYQTQISARCFQGDSKFLNGKEDLLENLYPGYLRGIKQRPVLLQVALCETSSGVLFIENEDCFLQAVDGFYPGTEDMTLVYAAGFRGSAERIRRPGGVRFAYLTDSARRADFEAKWFDTTSAPQDWFFWGDLDFSGMGILATLRRQFSHLTAWRPGYEPLLNRLIQGHELIGGSKERQVDPGLTGCAYADHQLLPALRTQGRGMDQEAWVPGLDG